MPSGRSLRLLTAALALFAIGAADRPQRVFDTLDNRRLSENAVDGLVQRMMTSHQVTGLGVAVIRKGKIVFIKSYGYAIAENKTPMTPATIMPGASLTKATFAWMLMQLVVEGKVDHHPPPLDGAAKGIVAKI